MAKEVDVFGFDELQKAFVRMERKYAVESDAMLAAQALQVLYPRVTYLWTARE